MTKVRVGLELRALNNMIRRYFEFSSHKKEIDSITGNNGWIIGYLANHPEQDIFQKDIEDHFTIARSTASKVLTLMEQKGLIQRQPVEQDARLKKIVLTDKAWEVREIMWKDAEKLEATLVEGFNEEDINKLMSYLNRMKENISAFQEKK
ncbi:MAG: MarR family winged helix-turn-helix transcriptional regulator [Oscillospiraceae bacterium]|nr:MarR family winged helix-turn-helix transcriptional regulator [Oscillospiraceae bacterium]